MGRDQLATRILSHLERRLARSQPGQRPRPIRAVAIARAFDIRPQGNRESRRRGVRLVIRDLREHGAPIVTDGDGYWLARDAVDHQAYRDFRRRNGLAHLAAAATDARSPATSDAHGQLGLFPTVR